MRARPTSAGLLLAHSSACWLPDSAFCARPIRATHCHPVPWRASMTRSSRAKTTTARLPGSARTAIPPKSLIASVTAEADAASPSDDELRTYLSDNADRFSFVAGIAVAAWQTDDDAVAQAFVAALRSDGSASVSDAIGAIVDLPSGLTPVEQLRDFLGPGITAAAADMPIGSSAVFARRGRWLVVQVLEKESAVITDLDKVRNRVLLDYRRSLADQALRDYLDDLRRRADVLVAQP
jgi:hypothetical protein